MLVEQMDPYERIRLEALKVAASTMAPTASNASIVNRAVEFERYIRQGITPTDTRNARRSSREDG